MEVKGDFSENQSVDGTDFITPNAEARFLKWLEDHGARFPKIAWPCRNTVNSVRGTVALDDISTNEKMLQIPQKLLMCPPNCRANKRIGHVFVDASLFRFGTGGLEMLAVFLMHERKIGEESFWYPYISQLPHPGTVSDWSNDELAECCDPNLVSESSNRVKNLKTQWVSLQFRLQERFPNDFPRDRYSFNDFSFAYRTISARAFGRRIKWMALVPFADNLNHSNVATKYDLDVNGNGVFRLFPTGTNEYKKGKEVFNSYGYRDNWHLMLHYGFAIPDNEWAKFPVPVQLNRESPGYRERSSIMRKCGRRESETIKLLYKSFCWEVLTHYRVSILTAEEADKISNSYDIFSLIAPLSERRDLERTAIRSLIEYYKYLLTSVFHTTEAEDEKLLKSAEKDKPRLYTAIVYRSTRRRMVQYQIDILELMIKVCTESTNETCTKALLDFVSAHTKGKIIRKHELNEEELMKKWIEEMRKRK